MDTQEPFDVLTIVAFGFLCLIGLSVVSDSRAFYSPVTDDAASAQAIIPLVEVMTPATTEAGAAADNSGSQQPGGDPGDPEIISPPYKNYVLTQGPHGFSYGHTAIDISAGKGAEILSPINGYVKAVYTDDYGNTTIILENSIYQVIMLHGLYTVNEGEVVVVGQVIGAESNQGYTVDGLGRSCRNRDCGYHTHLNIFDKRIGSNVNPLDLFGG